MQQAGARLGLGLEAVEAALVAADGDWAQAAAVMESRLGSSWGQAAATDGPRAPAGSGTAWAWGGGIDAWAAKGAPTAATAPAGGGEGQLGWPEDSASSLVHAGAPGHSSSGGGGSGKLAELSATAGAGLPAAGTADPGWLPPQFSGRAEAAPEEIDELLGLLGLAG